jgi:predicted outer membrane protein
MSQTKHVKLLAALAAVSLIANSVVGQNEQPRSPQQPGAQPGAQAPREGQQSRENSGQRSQARPGDQRIDRQSSHAELDKHLTAWLVVENEAQVMLSQQVAENAESDEVKQFAQQMVEHHQQITQRLQEVSQASVSEQASRGARTGQERPNQDRANQERPNQDRANQERPNQERANQERPNQERPNQERANQDQPRAGVPGQDQPRPEVAGQTQPRAEQTLPGQARQGQPGQEQRDNIAQRLARQDQSARRDLNQAGDGDAMVASQLTAIKQELCQLNLQTALEELQNKKGAEFDHCYMQLQVFVHQGMVNSIEIYQRHASDDLQSVLQEVGPKVESHLEKAKELVKKLDSNGAEG